MSEIEKRLKCPFCLEKISMLIDVSVNGVQTYTEDCEVCCHPILITYEARESEILSFRFEKAYE